MTPYRSGWTYRIMSSYPLGNHSETEPMGRKERNGWRSPWTACDLSLLSRDEACGAVPLLKIEPNFRFASMKVARPLKSGSASFAWKSGDKSPQSKVLPFGCPFGISRLLVSRGAGKVLRHKILVAFGGTPMFRLGGFLRSRVWKNRLLSNSPDHANAAW